MFGLYDTVAIAVIALGSALAGVLSDAIGVAQGPLAAAVVVAAVGAASWARAAALGPSLAAEDAGDGP